MTAPSVRPAKPAYHHGDLRKALLEAAEAELTEKGVEGFTLRGCAKRAGVSHAAPAHHFRDANALLSELAAEGFRRFSQAMRHRQAARQAPRDRLVGAGLGYIDFATNNPALFRLMFSSFRPDFDHEPLHGNASDAFAILVDSVGAVTGDDPLIDPAGRQDVIGAWATAHGLAELLLSKRMPLLDSIDETGIEAVLSGIIARAMPPPKDLPGASSPSGRD